jgi:hypothetical protein
VPIFRVIDLAQVMGLRLGPKSSLEGDRLRATSMTDGMLLRADGFAWNFGVQE